jgi:hypothetical protein
LLDEKKLKKKILDHNLSAYVDFEKQELKEPHFCFCLPNVFSIFFFSIVICFPTLANPLASVDIKLQIKPDLEKKDYP